ncbi:MFS transporter [Dactylosporangium sp. NPDC051541]|uniref:MFS transporter n=1 Tax=Dactylosporangium sp. NPDC051541 TaxID=3363977 RepID=UPI0037B45BD8
MHTGRWSLLFVPGAARFFAAAVVARLGVAMTGLAILWAVQATSGSLALGGAGTGAFAIAEASVGPQVARLIDRWGQRRVVPVTGTAFVGSGAALIAVCGGASPASPVGSYPAWSVVVLAAAAGATVPPVGALSAARWRHVLASCSSRLPAALALEGAANDTAFLLGPVLVTTLGTGVVAGAGLALAVLLVGGGVAGLLTATATEPPPGGPARGLLVDRRLLHRRFAALFAANLAMGLFFGGIGVAITAFALAHDAGALAGPIMAAAGVVSLAAGLVYAAAATRCSNSRPAPVMLTAALVITAGCAALARTPGVPVMFLGYSLVGGCVALVLIPGAVLVAAVTDRAVYTQALTWINSASALGIAVAAPAVGWCTGRFGWSHGFLLLAGCTALLPLTLLLAYPLLRDVRIGGRGSS